MWRILPDLFFPHKAQYLFIYLFDLAVYLCSYTVHLLGVRGHSNNGALIERGQRPPGKIEKMIRKKIGGCKCMKPTEWVEGGRM